MMTNEDKKAHLLRFHRFQKSREQFYSPAIFRAIRSQYSTLLTALHSGYTEQAAINKISSQPIVNVLKELYLDAGIVYGAKIRSDLNKQTPTRLSFQRPVMYLKHRMPMGFSESMRQLIEQYFQTDILNQSEGITETTKDLIRQVFTDAYVLGEGIDDIIKKLEDTELSRVRSRLIARTETVTAANAGALIVAKSTELDLKKEWLSASDSRVRLHHRHLNGQIVNLDGYFHDDDTGVTMKIPGAHVQQDGRPVPASFVVNCRCTTLFLVQD